MLPRVHAEIRMILDLNPLLAAFGINGSFDPAVVKKGYLFSLVEGFEHLIHFVPQVKNSRFHGPLQFLYSYSIHFWTHGQPFCDLKGCSGAVKRIEQKKACLTG